MPDICGAWVQRSVASSTECLRGHVRMCTALASGIPSLSLSLMWKATQTHARETYVMTSDRHITTYAYI